MLAAIYMICDGSAFSFVYEFSALSWTVVIISSILVILSQTTKATALKYHTASAL